MLSTMLGYLRRGALAGAAGSVLTAAVLLLLGERSLSAAIAIEAAQDAGGDEPLFSRPEQLVGGVAAVLLGGVAMGVCFGVVFAAVRHRVPGDDWRRALALAATGFGALFLVPFLKYPPNPPAVGDPGTVGRPEQRGGLFLATALYGIAAGGLFAIAFAVLRGRGAQRTDWELATRLAGAIFAAIVLVPFVKYPPNPPAVGDPATIADRTAYYLILLAGSALAMLAAARVVWSLRPGAAPWARPLAGALTFLAVAGGLALALPAVQEVPRDFPATLIWEFRLSSLGTQAVLWAALGAAFGIACHRTPAAAA